MRRPALGLLFVALALPGFGGATVGSLDGGSEGGAPEKGHAIDLAIVGVTVVDPASGRVLTDHSVHVDAGRIQSIEPLGSSGPPKARRKIDGRGLYLIPGLLDLHVHLTMGPIAADPDPTLRLLLAHGVTGVRDMAADCQEPRQPDDVCIEDMRRLASEIDAGTRVGPRLLGLAGSPVRGVWSVDDLPEGAPSFLAPGTAEQGAELARYLAERGVDLVKIYNTVSREAYFGLIEEAERLGLEVSGHLPFGVSVLEASNAGHRTIEHARDLPLACSPYGAEYRTVMERVILGENVDPPTAEVRLKRSVEGFDPELCTAVLATLAENGTILVPTHGTREMDARAADPDYRNDPRRAVIAPALLARWNKDLDNTAEVAPQLAELFLSFYELGLELTARAHQAGVTILAGTDANDTMIFPGSSLHDELERFAHAGIEPMDVLRTATTAPAAYLGRSNDLGAIAPGQLADLVLLRANPLDYITNTRQIEAVILAGRVHRKKELRKWIRQIEATNDKAERRLQRETRAADVEPESQNP